MEFVHLSYLTGNPAYYEKVGVKGHHYVYYHFLCRFPLPKEDTLAGAVMENVALSNCGMVFA